ncbi:MAG: septum formation inhibitor Maf [Alcanivoracaceae bacterium]|nr:septum formation inhibitor Maf [Alcanivoracaceae bacterium]
MNSIKIILASQSPRRKQLLQQIGVTPVCCPVDIDESIYEKEAAKDYCNRLAMEKAQAAWDNSDKSLAVIGSDTIVVLNGKTLGKPKDEEDAFNMLMMLSGQTHHVITAVAIINAQKQKVVDVISIVEFGLLNTNEITDYIASKEPMDKAGSYAIQGQAAKWIKNISGSYSGIMGLPLYETAKLLQEFT